MQRALVVYRVDRSDPSNLGVVYKLLGQVRGLEEAGYKVDFIIHDKTAINHSGRKIAVARPDIYFKWSYYDHIDRDYLKGYDLYIFRYGLATQSFVNCLRDIKDTEKTAAIYIDMPTYPYDQEWTGMKGRLAMWLDRRYASHLRKYVDGILHSGPEISIHSIPTLRITNGIDLSRVRLRTPKDHQGFRLLAMGKWRSWHGLDRLLLGLAKCGKVGKTPLLLDIIGEGPDIQELRSHVKKHKLEKHVKFYGAVHGEELDDLFDLADLGIGTLGLHRKGVEVDSSLKHREYVARGLPFILAGVDTDIDHKLPYVFKVPADESPVDLDGILSQLGEHQTHRERQEMRSYAEQHLSWDSKMKTLLEVIDIK